MNCNDLFSAQVLSRKNNLCLAELDWSVVMFALNRVERMIQNIGRKEFKLSQKGIRANVEIC